MTFAQGHCGYEFHLAKFGTHWFWRHFTTPTHHDLHHSSGRYNFGLWFRWWDLAMGTEHPQYLQKFLALTAEPRQDVTPADNVTWPAPLPDTSGR